jgi:FKBP-type peptidyl-prolyl cis-trans isomerase 2
MPTVQQGDTVRAHLTGRLDDDSVVLSTHDEGDPVEFTVGTGEVLPGIDETVEGMEAGETRTVALEPEEAFGHHSEERVMEVDKEHLPDDVNPEPGLNLQMQTPEGEQVPVTVTEVGEETITLDANHPLAGETVTYDIDLVTVVD